MLMLTLDHKTNIGNEFLGSVVYRKVVSYITYDLLVDKIHFLLISNFFDANLLIKKVAQSFFDANKAQQFPVLYMNAYQSKNQALVNISGFTMREIGLANRLLG